MVDEGVGTETDGTDAGRRAGRVDAVTARERLYDVMEGDGSFKQQAERALAVGVDHLGVENGHVTRIDRESNYWRAIVSTDPPDGRFPVGETFALDRTYCRRAIDEAGSLVLHDAPTQGWADDPAYRDHGLDCYHGTPLTVDGELFGTVCFVSVEGREAPFSPAETTFAELLARLLEADLQRRRTTEKVDRLEGFASVVSHDLRNPLNVAQGRLDMERESSDSENLRIAADALGRMESLIGDVLAVARGGQDVGDEDLTTRRLSAAVENCWAAVGSADASLTVEGDVAFRADPDRLRRLLGNLLRNAVEHGGSDVHVRVGPLDSGDGFYVADDGPGIAPDARERIFESGYTTGSGGAGLGLSIVEGIAAAHGWDVDVVEADGGGSRFEVTNVIVVTA